jgi:hypothetical protein
LQNLQETARRRREWMEMQMVMVPPLSSLSRCWIGTLQPDNNSSNKERQQMPPHLQQQRVMVKVKEVKGVEERRRLPGSVRQGSLPGSQHLWRARSSWKHKWVRRVQQQQGMSTKTSLRCHHPEGREGRVVIQGSWTPLRKEARVLVKRVGSRRQQDKRVLKAQGERREQPLQKGSHQQTGRTTRLRRRLESGQAKDVELRAGSHPKVYIG